MLAVFELTPTFHLVDSYIKWRYLWMFGRSLRASNLNMQVNTFIISKHCNSYQYFLERSYNNHICAIPCNYNGDFPKSQRLLHKEKFQLHQPWCIFLAGLGECSVTSIHLRSVLDDISGTLFFIYKYEINTNFPLHPKNQTGTQISFTILIAINKCSLQFR